MKVHPKIIEMVRAVFSLADVDIIKQHNNPKSTLLGLRSRPIHTVIDVGANVGQFAKYICEFYKDARVYCFEPVPEPFAALEKWADTQNGRGIPFNLAIGDSEGGTEMFLHEEHVTSSSMLATTGLTEQCYPFTKGQKRIPIRQATLDSALGDVMSGLNPEILIKLDVQGYENRVIAGGKQIFAMATVCILEINLDTLYEGQAEFKELLVMLDDLGYRYIGNFDQLYGKDGHCIYIDAVFLKKDVSRQVNAP